MKKSFCFLMMLALAAVPAALRAADASEPKRIEIHSTQELLNNLGSDRTLVLVEEYYNISETLLDPVNAKLAVEYTALESNKKCVFYVENFDGPELHIADFNNLTIEAGLEVVSIVTEPRYVNVFTFENCTNVTLKGLTIGHTEEGYCDNGVLGFTRCSGFQVIDCDLYGCGTEGVMVASCSYMYFKGTKIRDCSYHIMHLLSSSNIRFDSCQFFRNREFELLNVYDCDDVLFYNCMFANNTGMLFNVCSPVTFKDCVVLHDSDFLGDSENVYWINSILEEYFGENQALG